MVVNTKEDKNMMTLNEVKEALSDRNIREVARRTGLHHETIHRLQSGAIKNPSYETVSRLVNYLEGGK